MIGTYSGKLARQPGLAALLDEPVVHLRYSWQARNRAVRAVAGWGLRPTTRRPRLRARQLGLPFIALEDGFVRSWGTGATHPALSLVVDGQGIYYAADRPSDLETLLASDTDLLAGPGAQHAALRARLVSERFSKYNLAPRLSGQVKLAPGRRVLVVDQTRGDAGIVHGLADAESFARMLRAARAEHPGATLYVKTHPEVRQGSKRGYFDDVAADARTILVREPVNPLDLVEQMDHVYVVTSQLGFEALLMGKPVTCFGMPWYAGWGPTDDRVRCERRQHPRSVEELFAAAYLHYTRYLNPWTHERGTLADVMDWLCLQREEASRHTGRAIAVGFRRWKAANIRPFLAPDPRDVHFVRDAGAAAKLSPGPRDRLVTWGAAAPDDVARLARDCGAASVHVEDGFIRSIGLGSDFIRPISLVLDTAGLYFDPRQPSALENLLNTRAFTEPERQRAAAVRRFIVRERLTKYNIESYAAPRWNAQGRRVVLVPGQVEDDASIRHGCDGVRTNLALLQAARQACPDAYIVYKPHPDVATHNRAGRLHAAQALRHADHIECRSCVVSCIEASHEIHTMTSLTGFDALLRGKSVVVYGRPFYAGWGLTRDRLPIARRGRTLTLDELVAGTLLHYPLYRDWVLNGYTSCEAALRQLAHARDALQADRNMRAVRMNYLQRQWHKIKLWARAGFLVTR